MGFLKCVITVALFFVVPMSAWAELIQPLNIEEEDGVPTTYPWKLKVTNGSLTDNGDGTASLAAGAGAGGGGGGSSSLQFTESGVEKTSPTASINMFGNDFDVTAIGTTSYIRLSPSTTNYIWNSPTLLQGATFYTSSGAVSGQLSAGSMRVREANAATAYRAESTGNFETEFEAFNSSVAVRLEALASEAGGRIHSQNRSGIDKPELPLTLFTQGSVAGPTDETTATLYQTSFTATNLVATGLLTVAGQSVCQENGTDCPAYGLGDVVLTSTQTFSGSNSFRNPITVLGSSITITGSDRGLSSTVTGAGSLAGEFSATGAGARALYVTAGVTSLNLTASRNVRTDSSGFTSVGPIQLDGGANEVSGILPEASLAHTYTSSFTVTKDIRAGFLTVVGTATINGQSPCLEDGTDCPVSGGSADNLGSGVGSFGVATTTGGFTGAGGVNVTYGVTVGSITATAEGGAIRIANDDGQIDFYNTANSGSQAFIESVNGNFLKFYNAGAFPITFFTNDVERMRIGGDGTVNIGSIGHNISAVTGNYTLTSTSTVVLANATGGSLNVTLPTAVGITGRLYKIKRTNSGGNTVTIATTGGQTIDGSATQVLAVQYESMDVISDGAQWYIF